MNEATGRVPLAVTVRAGMPEAAVAEARARAKAWGLPWLPRGREPLSGVLEHKADALIVFRADGVALCDLQGELQWSPGMAQLRLKVLEQGGADTLVEVAGLRTGEAVLDCTLGLGQDTLVAARAVGPSGRVVALEKSLPLYAVVSEGLQRRPADPLSAGVETFHADAGEYLRTLPTGSFDVVLFDPMFSRPRKSQAAFEMLRRYADMSPLTRETLHEAQRVARRAVVIKGSKYSDDLRRLGLQPVPRTRYADVVWACVPGLGA